MSALYDRRNATILVVHYLGDGKPPVASESELRQRANPYNYDYPEYDYGIIADGTVIPMRPLTVRGAHTISDIPEMTHPDMLWWNKNAISIVIGVGDGYVATSEQITSLGKFIRNWMANPNHITYRHSDITRTDCPNLSKEVWEGLFKEEKNVEDLILYADGDLPTALLLSYKLGAPTLMKELASPSLLANVKNIHHIGVLGTNGSGHFYYAGSDRIDTARKVIG